MRSEAREVAEHLSRNRSLWLPHVFKGGRIKGGYFQVADVDGNKGDSLNIPLRLGKPKIKDFGRGGWSGDDLDLLAQTLGLSLGEAIAYAQDHFGAPRLFADGKPGGRTGNGRAAPPPPPPPPEPEAAPPEHGPGEIPPPPDEPPPDLRDRGAPDHRFEYTDAIGRTIQYVCRWDARGGLKKEIRPQSFRDGRWQWKGAEGVRPLFGLAELASRPGATVCIVEGELKCLHAREVWPDHVWLTWAHGAQSVAKTGYGPLAGRDVVLVPDNDDAGIGAMEELARRAYAAGAHRVRRVVWPNDTPPGWDIGDELPAGWDADTVERLIAEAVEVPRPEPEPMPSGGPTDDADDDFYSAAELQDAVFQPLRYVVANLITEGLVVIGGKPKLGKTTLLTGIALAVAEGGTALGKVAVEAGDVLMVALESNQRAMQRLLRSLLVGRSMPEHLTITHTMRRLDDGGLDKIRRWLASHPNARAVIVDTWGKVRPSMSKNANPYDHDYHWASELKKLADEFRVAVIAITHLRKAAAEDVFDEIGGSSGLTAAADVNIVIKRERGQCDAVLKVTGREIEEQELALSFEYPLWRLLGDAEAYRLSLERVAICRALSRTPGMTAKQVADELGKKAPNITNLLKKLLSDGFVRDIGGGKWVVSASAPH